ncbi:MAG: hypothetical protein B6D56_01020 [Candidatus Omnitrophica bacterium 4484_70.1]|nr:MAG: hypothetical protein B6D56_01020 [Candidatus Omnitrophica bacterium 4484_70.1]
MPIYIYKVKDERKGCSYCKKGFEVLQKGGIPSLSMVCPRCGEVVEKVVSNFSLGFSKTGLDRRAREKGFHKLKRVDKGKYERLY